MKPKIEEQRFEFVLYINNNIICQRYFNIRDFNESSVNSLELKELMDNLIGMNNNGQEGSLGIIPNFLKKKSKEYLWGSYKPYAETQYEETIKNNYYKITNYQLEIKVDKKVIVKGEFSGNVFQPPSAKNQTNIGNVKNSEGVVIQEGIIPEIQNEIRYYLSQKNYTIDSEIVKIKKEIELISNEI